MVNVISPGANFFSPWVLEVSNNRPATVRLAIEGDDGWEFLDPHFISLSAVHYWAPEGDFLSGTALSSIESPPCCVIYVNIC